MARGVSMWGWWMFYRVSDRVIRLTIYWNGHTVSMCPGVAYSEGAKHKESKRHRPRRELSGSTTVPTEAYSFKTRHSPSGPRAAFFDGL